MLGQQIGESLEFETLERLDHPAAGGVLLFVHAKPRERDRADGGRISACLAVEQGVHDVEVAHLTETASGLAYRRQHAVSLALARPLEVPQDLSQPAGRHSGIVHAVRRGVAKRGKMSQEQVKLMIEKGMR